MSRNKLLLSGMMLSLIVIMLSFIVQQMTQPRYLDICEGQGYIEASNNTLTIWCDAKIMYQETLPHANKNNIDGLATSSQLASTQIIVYTKKNIWYHDTLAQLWFFDWNKLPKEGCHRVDPKCPAYKLLWP